MVPSIEDWRWLTSDDAARFLVDDAKTPLTTLAKRLRKELSPERASLVLLQRDLRDRAAAKFTLADKMFFTRQGLEQASGEAVGRHKASRLPGAEPVADLCCGVGGDLISLGRRGPTVAVDNDPVVLELARANAEVNGIEATFHLADAATWSADRSVAWHLDPDRRPEGRRTTRIENMRPAAEDVENLLRRCPDGGVKLAPATRLPDDWQSVCEQEWIAHQGECKQLVAWWGALAHHPGKRTASLLDRDGRSLSVVAGEPDAAIDPCERLFSGAYLYEPNPAALAARLSGELARKHNLLALSNDNGYLTSENLVNDPAMTAFRCLESMPFDRKLLRGWLKPRNIGKLEVKKRNLDVDVDQVRRQLQGGGNDMATLIITRTPSGRTLAIFAERV